VRLREKFENCIGLALPRARAKALADVVERLDTLADMRALSALLSAPQPAEVGQAVAARR
jgi:hypothetical protein